MSGGKVLELDISQDTLDSLDPNEWYVDSYHVRGEKKYAEIRQRLYTPGKSGDLPYQPRPTQLNSDGFATVIVCSDHQAPYHDQKLHEAFCQYVEGAKPDILVVLGDLIDFQPLSRFVDNPRMSTTVQSGIDSAYRILQDYRIAAPLATIHYLPGNHEERLQTMILSKVPSLTGVTKALQSKGFPAMSVQELLRLSELDIHWEADRLGDWPQTQLHLSKFLTLTHGWLAKKNSGASALAMMEHLSRSVIVGHTHRQGIVFKTTHDTSGSISVHTGVEVGTMCKVKGGLGYAVNPNWQNGFCTFTLYRDGRFSTPQLVSYINGRLYLP